MSVFRIEKTNNYTVMSNYHLREREMRRISYYMQRKRNSYKIDIKRIERFWIFRNIKSTKSKGTI